MVDLKQNLNRLGPVLGLLLVIGVFSLLVDTPGRLLSPNNLRIVLSQTVKEGWFLTAGTGVAVFFTSAMVAHRTLYEARPSAAYLTEFYLWMSLGGVLGGLFAALIAPQIFSEVFEYPLLLALSMACRPRALSISWKDRDELLVMWLLVATGILALIWIPWLAATFELNYGEYGMTAAIVAVFAVGILLFWKWPPRQLVASEP